MDARRHQEIHDIQRRRWFHSSRVKLPLVYMSASWFLVSTYLIWSLGSKLIVPLLLIFDYCFMVFKDVQLRLALRRMCVCGNVVHMRRLLNITVSLLLVFGFLISRAVSCLTSVARCWVSWWLGAVRRTQLFYHQIP